jgi:hypothetical protein
MPYALARRVRGDVLRDYSAARWVYHVVPFLITKQIRDERAAFEAHEFFANFGSIPFIVERTVSAATAADVYAKGESLGGKVVMIGRARPGDAPDMFRVPGVALPVAGVYLQAAGVYTLLDAPLYRLTAIGRVVIDVLVTLIPTAMVLLRSVRNRIKTSLLDPSAMAKVLGCLVLIGGYFGVVWTRVLWTDYIPVGLSLLLHGPLERFVAATAYSLRRIRRRST